MSVKNAALLIAAGLGIVVLLQNVAVTEFRFLFWSWSMSRLLLFVVFFAAGFVAGFLAGKRSW